MAIIAMLSAKGSPGVSATALACTLSWSPLRRTVLAECDPAGGDILAGYLARLEIPAMGLLPLAVADLRDRTRDEFPRQLIDLDSRRPGHRLVLPGITDPVQAGTIRSTWDRLAAFFADLEHGDPPCDVIADCGRLTTSAPPWPLLYQADVVILIVRATSVRTLAPAAAAVAHLRRELTNNGRGAASLTAVLVGTGPYPRREVEQRLHVPIIGDLPDDRRTAAILSDGGRLRGSQPLLRAAAALEPAVRQVINTRRAQLNVGTGAPRG